MRQKRSTRQRRSRRRKCSRGREMFLGFMMFLLTLILLVVLIVAGVFGYQFWNGTRISDTPLETSGEVIPETLPNLY